jgi:hypothetical protein
MLAITKTIQEFEWTGYMGLMLYWLPLSFCAVFYTVRTARNYVNDRRRREDNERNYYPTDTLGSLIGRGIVSVFPIVNIWAALFDLAPVVFGKAFKWIGKIFNQPLVPERKRNK